MKMGHIRIEHDESKDMKAYKGVTVDISEGGKTVEKLTFNFGDPEEDFANAVMWFTGDRMTDHVSMSSSCDHFTMDVKDYGWYENGILGELIKKIGSKKGDWHKIVRRFGKNQGKEVWIQEGGSFVVLDNNNGVKLISPDGEVDAPNGHFASVEEAIKYCQGLKRKVIWE